MGRGYYPLGQANYRRPRPGRAKTRRRRSQHSRGTLTCASCAGRGFEGERESGDRDRLRTALGLIACTLEQRRGIRQANATSVGWRGRAVSCTWVVIGTRLLLRFTERVRLVHSRGMVGCAHHRVSWRIEPPNKVGISRVRRQWVRCTKPHRY